MISSIRLRFAQYDLLGISDIDNAQYTNSTIIAIFAKLKSNNSIHLLRIILVDSQLCDSNIVLNPNFEKIQSVEITEEPQRRLTISFEDGDLHYIFSSIYLADQETNVIG